MSEFDLTRILTGSEATLAFITEARLDITRLPKGAPSGQRQI